MSKRFTADTERERIKGGNTEVQRATREEELVRLLRERVTESLQAEKLDDSGHIHQYTDILTQVAFWPFIHM